MDKTNQGAPSRSQAVHFRLISHNESWSKVLFACTARWSDRQATAGGVKQSTCWGSTIDLLHEGVRDIVVAVRRLVPRVHGIVLIGVLIRDESPQGSHVAFAGTQEAAGQAGFPVQICSPVAHPLNESHLLRQPSVQSGGANLGVVYAKAAMNSRAVQAHEDSQVHASPGRSSCVAVCAFPVVLVLQQLLEDALVRIILGLRDCIFAVAHNDGASHTRNCLDRPEARYS